MKTVNLEKEKLDLKEVINLARKAPVLLLTSDGKEFLFQKQTISKKKLRCFEVANLFRNS